MAGPNIEEIRLRELDASENEIQLIFAKKTPECALYHDRARIVVQFADDPDREEKGVSRLLANELVEMRRAPCL